MLKDLLTFKSYQCILLIALIGTLARLYNLERTGLLMDEIHSSIGAEPDKTFSEVMEYCKADQPPVFFLMLHTWYKSFGYNDFLGRFFGVLTGLLGIIAAYYLGRECKNERVGLMTSFLTSINYFHIDLSRQVRFYPLVFLLTALSYLFFIRVIKTKRNLDYLLYLLFTSLLLNTHYFGMVVFVSQFILFIALLVLTKQGDMQFIVKSLFVGVLIGLSFLHWLPNVLSDLGINNFHIQPLKWYFPASYYWVYFRDVITCIVTLLMLSISFRQIYLKNEEKFDFIGRIILPGWIVLGFLIPLIYSLVKIPMLEYKYSIIVLPSLFVLIAIGFDVINNRILRMAIPFVLFISFTVNALFVKSIYFREPFEQWREVAKEVLKTDSSDQTVFTDYAWYLRYYFKVLGSSNRPFEQRFADFDGHLNQSMRVWVLTQTKYPDQGLSLDQQQQIDKDFKFIKEEKFIDTNAKLYVRR
jgi:mannosyltransferase